jgi:GAF domain-containing protein
MQDSVDVSHQADRRAIARSLRRRAVPIRGAWHQIIAEQRAFTGSITAEILDEYLAALARFIERPDPAVPQELSSVWCHAVMPDIDGVAQTAVAMGLLGEALRRTLLDVDAPQRSEVMFAALCSTLPDFSAEFVRGLMRGSDQPPGEQHWYEVSQELTAEREHKLTQLAILNDVSVALSSTLSLEELYRTIYEQCGRLVDTSNFFIVTLEPGSAAMTPVLYYFGGVRNDEIVGRSVAMGLTRVVVERGEPVLVEDYVAECRAHGVEIRPEIDTSKRLAWLGAPMIAGSRIVGLLVVMTDAGPLDASDAEILAAVARQAGAAIENARLFEAQRDHAAKLQAINQLSRAIATIHEPDALMQRACELIKETFDYACVSTLLVDLERNLLLPRAQAGIELTVPLDSLVQDIGSLGLISHAALTRQPVLANDVSLDPRYMPSPLLQRTRAEFSIPLLREGVLIGILDVQSPHVNAFSPQDVELLTSIADQLAVALENARLFTAQTEQATKLRAINQLSRAITTIREPDALLQRACELTTDLFGYACVAILMADPEQRGLVLRAYAGVPIDVDPFELTLPIDGPGLVSLAAATRRPVLVNDVAQDPRYLAEPVVQDVRSELTIPLLREDELLGVIDVQSPELSAFTDQDVELLTTIADQLAIALENARLFTAQRDQAQQLQAINQLSRAIATMHEPDELMRVSCDLIKETFGHAIVSVLLAHPDNDKLMLRAQTSRGELDEPIGLTFTIGGPGLISLAAVTRRPILSNDVTQDQRYLFRPSAEGIQSELAVPLLRNDQLLGVLDIQSPHLDAFSEQDVDALTTVADQLAIALENAELLVQERKRRTELALILEVSQAASSSLVLDDVIQRVAEGMADAVGLPSCVVYLYDDEGDRLLPSAYVAREGSELDTVRIGEVIPTPDRSQLLRRIFLSGQEACAIEMMSCDVDDDLARVLCASAVLAVPFVVKQEFLGFALLVAHDVEYHFSPHQLRVAFGVAGAAGLALENARLYARSHTLGMAEERIRVAREIHDGIAQGLTAVSLHLEAADQMFDAKPDKTRAKIERALELTRANLEAARRSVLDLHASALQELTLVEAIQRRIQQFVDDHREDGLTGTFSGEAMYGRLSSRMELSLYRIFEEALENIDRHAGALHVDVSLARHGDDVILTIRDNGRGFDVEKAFSSRRTPGTFGLVAIRERVRLLHGNLQVHSAGGSGTELVVTVPFEAPHAPARNGVDEIVGQAAPAASSGAMIEGMTS